jgi:hypothetical protein
VVVVGVPELNPGVLKPENPVPVTGLGNSNWSELLRVVEPAVDALTVKFESEVVGEVRLPPPRCIPRMFSDIAAV